MLNDIKGIEEAISGIHCNHKTIKSYLLIPSSELGNEDYQKLQDLYIDFNNAVQNVKNQIINFYQADPYTTQTFMLLGIFINYHGYVNNFIFPLIDLESAELTAVYDEITKGEGDYLQLQY